MTGSLLYATAAQVLKLQRFSDSPNEPHQNQTGENKMKNPLDSIWGTVISGLVLTIILYMIAINFLR